MMIERLIQPPPGWAVEARPDPSAVGRLEREARTRRAAHRAAYVAAARAYGNGLAEPERLGTFVAHRLEVAQRFAGGRRVPRWELADFERRAGELAEQHGAVLRAAVEVLPEPRWLQAADWFASRTLEAPLPGPILELGQPLAVAIGRLLREYGFGQPPRGDGQPGSGDDLTRHSVFCTERWPEAVEVEISMVHDLGDGAVHRTRRREWRPHPVTELWRAVSDAARRVDRRDIFEVTGVRRS
jgi:hypothetical protein